VAVLGGSGGGVVSTLPFECWRVPQSLEKGGYAFQCVASADNNINHKQDCGHFSKYEQFLKWQLAESNSLLEATGWACWLAIGRAQQDATIQANKAWQCWAVAVKTAVRGWHQYCPLCAGGFLNPWARGGVLFSALPMQTTTYRSSEVRQFFPKMKIVKVTLAKLNSPCEMLGSRSRKLKIAEQGQVSVRKLQQPAAMRQ
jgi:hypothetical protein